MRLALFILAFTGAVAAQTVCPDLEGDQALACIRANYRPTLVLEEAPSKDRLYDSIDSVRVDGVLGVEALYSGYFVPFDGQPNSDPSQDVYNGNSGISQEHVFPRSRGTDGNQAETDLHHLYPEKQSVNAARSNDPFAILPDAVSSRWYQGATSTQSRPSDTETWSQSAGGSFEPRQGARGDVARAMFYVASVYTTEVDVVWFESQLSALLTWHGNEPATDSDVARSERVAQFQSGCGAGACINPFIVDVTLARRAFAPGTVDSEDGPDAPVGSVWPNPARDRVAVRLEMPSLGQVKVDIYDALGRRVRSTETMLGQGPRTVDVRLVGLSRGIYIVRASYGSRMFSTLLTVLE